MRGEEIGSPGLVDVQKLIEELKRQVGTCPRDYYSPAEVAKMLGRAEFTCREWCRLGRIRAEKMAVGRGSHKGWKISAAEVARIRDHGILPDPRLSHRA